MGKFSSARDCKDRAEVRVCKDGIRRNALRPRTPEETQARFWEQVEKTKGCWVWTGCTGGVYPYGQFCVNTKNTKVHRYSYELHEGPIPSGKIVRHKCDNSLCVNPEHLEIGTQKDNCRDKMERGRHRYGIHIGEDNARSKWTKRQVERVCEMKCDGIYTHAFIAEATGVSLTSVGAILQGRVWRHVSQL